MAFTSFDKLRTGLDITDIKKDFGCNLAYIKI